MRRQPPKSPDFNVLDLAIFNAIQSRQYQVDTSKLDELIIAVTKAFNAIPSNTVEKCFLTLQKVMESVIRCGGGNEFALPRVSKAHIRNGIFPMSIPCDKSVYEAGQALLKTM